MQLGEVLTMEDCLYVAIIQSANEVCAQIAEHVGGTEEHFIEMMNQKAQELGCENTHFVNASGLPDENHYTTAYDMAKILQAGLANKTFRKIIKKVNYTVPATNFSEARSFHTHIPLIAKESEYYDPDCIGGKSGYTQEAKYTLAVAAKRDDTTYIAVVMRADDLGQSSADCTALLDYGFTNFAKTDAAQSEAEAAGELNEQETADDSQTAAEEEVDPETEEETAPEAGAVSEATEAPSPTAEAAEEQASAKEDHTEQQGLSELSKYLLAAMAVLCLILVILIVALCKKNRRRRL
jgi:D-alanyl-D-alanine carboxypeptidase